MDYEQGRWVECRHGFGAYGGTFIENAVQAISRDVFAAAMQRVEGAGYPVTLHVHDEICCEAPDGFGSAEEFLELITTAPDWAPGLPIACKAREGQRFAKVESKDPAPGAEEVVPVVPPPRATEKPAEAFSDEGSHLDTPEFSRAASISPEITAEMVAAASISGASESVVAAVPAPLPPPPQEDPPLDDPPPRWNGGAGNGDGHAHGGNGNGSGDHRDWGQRQHSSDGHVHGDSWPVRGRLIGRWIYQHPDRPNYLRVDKHILPDGDRKFYQFHFAGGQWVSRVKGTYAERKIPYRLPELMAALRADPNTQVQITEGEKDADTMIRMGFVATTNPGGALSWTEDMTAWLRTLGVRRAVTHEDRDKKGELRTTNLTAALSDFIDLRVVRYPDVPPGEDVTYWVDEQGHSKDELLARIEAAPKFVPGLDEWDAGDLLDSGLPEPRQWLLSKQFCRGFLSSLVAPGDVGKTTLRLTQAIELATHHELLGLRIYQRCRVLVISLEDDRQELHRRLLAICHHHHVHPAELKGWLFCRELNGVKLAKLNKGERELGELDAMLQGAIERRRPDLIILDPFVKLHSLNENDNPDMDFVCSRLAKIAQEYNIAIDSPAHTHKGTIVAGDPDARRGASAQRDAGRLDFTLTVMTEGEAERFGVDPDERKSYVRLQRAKANIVRSSTGMWFQLVNVPLGNATEQYPDGDEVQALEPWTPPDAWQDLDAERINLILDRIDAGLPDGNRYSAEGNAKKRAVWPVITDVMPEKTDAQAREIIKAWLSSNLLTYRDYKNPTESKSAKGLWVDPAKRPPRA